jgi:hypothetical protein
MEEDNERWREENADSRRKEDEVEQWTKGAKCARMSAFCPNHV